MKPLVNEITQTNEVVVGSVPETLPGCCRSPKPPTDATSGDANSLKKETQRHVSRFLVIGVLSVMIDGFVYAMLTKFGMSENLAKAVSYCSGMLFGFVGNKAWTFESRRKSLTEPATYVAIYAVTLAVNVGVNAVVLYWAMPLLPLRAARLLAFLVATGITTVLNFLGMRMITFREGIQLRRQAESANNG